VTEYPHLQGALYRQIILQNEFLGTVAIYLIVLNKLKVCTINAPLLLLSTGEKLSEFCQWLLTDAEGLTIEEKVAYQTVITTYNIVDDKEVKRQMGRKVWKPDYDQLAGYLYEGMPPDIMAKFIQSLLRTDSPNGVVQKVLGVDSPKEVVLKLARTKEQKRDLLEFLQQELND